MEIVVAAASGTPRFKIYDGSSNLVLADLNGLLLGYDASYKKGTRVALGDANDDGTLPGQQQVGPRAPRNRSCISAGVDGGLVTKPATGSLVEHAQVQCPGMQIDAAVECVLLLGSWFVGALCRSARRPLLSLDPSQMNQPSDSNPVAGIRAVFLAGFLTGNACGLSYLAITGHLWESVALNPLALIGAFLGIGLVGTMIGGVSGLSLRLLLGDQNAAGGWQAPVMIAVAASAVAGLLISSFLVAALWGNAP